MIRLSRRAAQLAITTSCETLASENDTQIERGEIWLNKDNSNNIMDSEDSASTINETFKDHLNMEWEVFNARDNPMAELQRLHSQAFHTSQQSRVINNRQNSKTEQGELLVATEARPWTEQDDNVRFAEVRIVKERIHMNS